MPLRDSKNLESIMSGLKWLFEWLLAEIENSTSVLLPIFENIFWLRWYCSISLGDLGEIYSDPSGLPYQVTGTLKGLPPSPGWIFRLKKGNAGYEGDCGLSLTFTLE